jgi:uncharacterized protein
MSDPGESYLIYLQDKGCDPGVIAHSLVVRDVAVGIADRIISRGEAAVDRDLVAAGAILHDIGRSETHGMDHADVGGRISRDIGLPESLSHIIERHIGAGLSGDERAAFGLCADDRFPESLEEKIVAHADNLVKGTRIISREDLNHSIKKFPQSVQERFSALADELETLAGSPLP